MTEQHLDESLADRIQETIDRTATSIEEIHKSIAEIPLDLMRSAGVLEQTTEDMSDLQERSIAAVYDVIRDANCRVMGLASDLLRPPSADAEAHSE